MVVTIVAVMIMMIIIWGYDDNESYTFFIIRED